MPDIQEGDLVKVKFGSMFVVSREKKGVKGVWLVLEIQKKAWTQSGKAALCAQGNQKLWLATSRLEKL